MDKRWAGLALVVAKNMFDVFSRQSNPKKAKSIHEKAFRPLVFIETILISLFVAMRFCFKEAYYLKLKQCVLY